MLWLSLLQTILFLRKLIPVLLHYIPADEPGNPEFKTEPQMSDSELSTGWSLVAAYPSAPVLQSETEDFSFEDKTPGAFVETKYAPSCAAVILI